MLVYSIRQARHGRQASKIRAMSKAGAQHGAQQASIRKSLKDNSASLTTMLQNEQEYRKTLYKSIGISPSDLSDI